MLELLTTQQMRRADAATIKAGTPGIELMERAGLGVALKIIERWQKPCPVTVLCGPGNNGGDGFIVARILKEKGWPVTVACLAQPAKLTGDAALAAQRWAGPCKTLSASLNLERTKIVVDAVFGIGFKQKLPVALRNLFLKINDRKIPVVAIDVPSGLNADTGTVATGTPKSVMTITFCRKKPGHLLMPGKNLCGTVHVVDIGISDQTVAATGSATFENHPGLWLPDYPLSDASGHKYTRGHALVLGGPKMTGASKLASIAAARMGAGLVTLAVPEESFAAYASSCAPSLIVEPMKSPVAEFVRLLLDPKRDVALLGPGAGVSENLQKIAKAVLATQKPVVLDADVFTAFAGKSRSIMKMLNHAILTPHEGEFKRFFGQTPGSKIERATAAARKSGAIIVLKGADTVVAAPDGTAIINSNAPPTLATAGSGDVLAGMILGLLAQKMPPFQAAAAAVWMHGEAARFFGLGLIATDLTETIPAILNSLFFKEKTKKI